MQPARGPSVLSNRAPDPIPVKKLLLQLDSSPHPSVFDRVVAFDAGADEVMSYGGVTVGHRARSGARCNLHAWAQASSFHRHLHWRHRHGAGRTTPGAVKKAFFGPLRVSVMLDSNGSNTTAVAAVVKMRQAAGSLDGRSARCHRRVRPGRPARRRTAREGGCAGGRHVAASGRRFACRNHHASASAAQFAKSRWPTAPAQSQALEGAEMFLNAGPAGVCLIPRAAWVGRPGLQVAGDVNAVPPLGVEGIEVTDDGADERA